MPCNVDTRVIHKQGSDTSIFKMLGTIRITLTNFSNSCKTILTFMKIPFTLYTSNSIKNVILSYQYEKFNEIILQTLNVNL